jgi:tripartite-type tricarboxylate transporter receptor subunit TctC
MELFKAMAGVDFAQIPYRGTAPAVLAALSGEVSVIIAPTIALLPHVRSGALRALAISGEQRSPALTELPTVAEAGVPGFETYQWYGILVPSRTPHDIVARLNRGIGDVIRAPNVETLLASQALVPATDTPEEFKEFMHAQIDKWAKVLKATDVPPP